MRFYEEVEMSNHIREATKKVFARLGLDENASAEEITAKLCDPCMGCREQTHKPEFPFDTRNKCWLGNIGKCLLNASSREKSRLDLLATYGQREREAGERAMWEVMCHTTYCHRYIDCDETFEGCLLRKDGA